eukprot:gene25635-biopygen24001
MYSRDWWAGSDQLHVPGGPHSMDRYEDLWQTSVVTVVTYFVLIYLGGEELRTQVYKRKSSGAHARPSSLRRGPVPTRAGPARGGGAIGTCPVASRSDNRLTRTQRPRKGEQRLRAGLSRRRRKSVSVGGGVVHPI